MIAIAPIVPELVDQAGLSGYGWAVAVVGVAGAVTRIIAIPAVNAALTRIGLGASPSREISPGPRY